MSREQNILWVNRILWALTIECVLGVVIEISRGGWGMAAFFVGCGFGTALVALTPPRQVIRKREG